jgi:uncharacterized protein (TIGR02302 family)
MTAPAVPTRLARKRRFTAAILWAERLLPALTPSFALLFGYCALAWFGLLARLPAPAVLVLLLTASLGATVLAVLRVGRLAPPTAPDIDRRLERREPHHPLTTLSDRPAFAGADAIWQAHRERALARVPALRPGLPHLDPPTSAALAGALLLALTAAMIAGQQAPALLWRALTPNVLGPQAAPPRLQAWIVPPSAMGLPPVFLHPGDTGPISVPPGAHLTVSLAGGAHLPSLVFAGAATPFHRLDRTSFQADLTLTQSGTLAIDRNGTRLAGWRITVAPDQPPTIAITGPASVSERRLVVPWRATDDYGLAAITAELRLQLRPGAPPLIVNLPLGGAPRSATGGALPDLTAHPWAGLTATLRYVARDGAGHTTQTAGVAVTLPARSFLNPAARALIAVRRALVIDPADTAVAGQVLDHLSDQLAGQLPLGQFLNLRAIAALLAQQPTATDQAEARLWRLALQIEDAGVADAKQRLADARAALSDALAAPPSPAQQQKIEQLTQALQQAMQQYLQAMNRQAAQSGQAPPEQPGGRSIDAAQLQQMEKDMADAARAGRTEEAQQRLAELGAILDALRQSNKLAGSSQAANKPDPALQNLMQDQAGLRSHTDQRLSQDADPRTSTAPEQDPDEAASAPDPATQRQQDASAQSALRQRLGALAQKLGDQTGAVPDGLAKADTAMRDAQSALAQGDDKAAQAAQQRALDGLRSAGSQMAQSGAGGQRPGPGTDPLGRAITEGANGTDDGDITLPTQGDAARSRALRDELRRRAADQTRPPAELEYIQRLLKY